MNFNHPGTELLFTTIPIQAKKSDDTYCHGTGFIVSIQINDKSSIPLLITNHHVINDSDSVFVDFFKTASNEAPITDEKIKVEIDSNLFSPYQNSELDITFVPIAPILQTLSEKNEKAFYRSISEKIVYSSDKEKKLAAIEEVTFIGYPYGLIEISNNLPIVRRGITATPVWSSHNENTFLIDAGVFPGSSGSPVFIYNQGTYSDGPNTVVGTRLVFLGMIRGSIRNDNKQFIGLGEVIKANAIFKFINEKINSDTA